MCSEDNKTPHPHTHTYKDRMNKNLGLSSLPNILFFLINLIMSITFYHDDDDDRYQKAFAYDSLQANAPFIFIQTLSSAKHTYTYIYASTTFFNCVILALWVQ